MADGPMDVGQFLREREERVLAAAHATVGRAHLAHYEVAGTQVTDDRLRALLDLLIDCCDDHRLDPVVAYADRLAAERHGSGYPLTEVQTAINVLEEAVWHAISSEAPPADQGYALGLVSTALGVVKDRVACSYIEQITSRPAKTLRLDYLFGGSEGMRS